MDATEPQRPGQSGGDRPSRQAYYMGIAIAVRERAKCLGSRVGAVLVLGDRVVATGYNGTPAGFPNCDEGGCLRCRERERFGRGEAYDVCVCVHAEQNALLTAARFGIAVAGAELYTTTRPCFGCTKELLQAGVAQAHYLHDWVHPNAELRPLYEELQAHVPGWLHRVEMADPRAEWAMPGRLPSPLDIGHSSGRS